MSSTRYMMKSYRTCQLLAIWWSPTGHVNYSLYDEVRQDISSTRYMMKSYRTCQVLAKWWSPTGHVKYSLYDEVLQNMLNTRYMMKSYRTCQVLAIWIRKIWTAGDECLLMHVLVLPGYIWREFYFMQFTSKWMRCMTGKETLRTTLSLQ